MSLEEKIELFKKACKNVMVDTTDVIVSVCRKEDTSIVEFSIDEELFHRVFLGEITCAKVTYLGDGIIVIEESHSPGCWTVRRDVDRLVISATVNNDILDFSAPVGVAVHYIIFDNRIIMYYPYFDVLRNNKETVIKNLSSMKPKIRVEVYDNIIRIRIPLSLNKLVKRIRALQRDDGEYHGAVYFDVYKKKVIILTGIPSSLFDVLQDGDKLIVEDEIRSYQVTGYFDIDESDVIINAI